MRRKTSAWPAGGRVLALPGPSAVGWVAELERGRNGPVEDGVGFAHRQASGELQWGESRENFTVAQGAFGQRALLGRHSLHRSALAPADLEQSAICALHITKAMKQRVVAEGEDHTTFHQGMGPSIAVPYPKHRPTFMQPVPMTLRPRIATVSGRSEKAKEQTCGSFMSGLNRMVISSQLIREDRLEPHVGPRIAKPCPNQHHQHQEIIQHVPTPPRVRMAIVQSIQAQGCGRNGGIMPGPDSAELQDAASVLRKNPVIKSPSSNARTSSLSQNLYLCRSFDTSFSEISSDASFDTSFCDISSDAYSSPESASSIFTSVALCHASATSICEDRHVLCNNSIAQVGLAPGQLELRLMGIARQTAPPALLPRVLKSKPAVIKSRPRSATNDVESPALPRVLELKTMIMTPWPRCATRTSSPRSAHLSASATNVSASIGSTSQEQAQNA